MKKVEHILTYIICIISVIFIICAVILFTLSISLESEKKSLLPIFLTSGTILLLLGVIIFKRTLNDIELSNFRQKRVSELDNKIDTITLGRFEKLYNTLYSEFNSYLEKMRKKLKILCILFIVLISVDIICALLVFENYLPPLEIISLICIGLF